MTLTDREAIRILRNRLKALVDSRVERALEHGTYYPEFIQEMMADCREVLAATEWNDQ